MPHATLIELMSRPKSATARTHPTGLVNLRGMTLDDFNK